MIERILVDDTYAELAAQLGSAVASRPLLWMGKDPTNARRWNVDSAGAGRLEEGGAPGAAAPSRALQFAGTFGGNLKTMLVDATGAHVVLTMSQAIQLGLITGRTGFLNALIYNAGLTVDAYNSLREFSYSPPATTQTCRLVSSSAVDSDALATGARKIRMTFFTDTGGTLNGPFTEDVALNGTTAVNMSNQARFFESGIVVDAATPTTEPAGTITLQNNAAGTICTLLGPSGNEIFDSICTHYVPNGYTCFFGDIWLRTSFVAARIGLRYKNPLNANEAWKFVGAQQSTGATSGEGMGQQQKHFTPAKVVGPAVVEFYVQQQASSLTVDFFASTSWWEIPT